MILAAHTDDTLRKMHQRGDPAAKSELIRRGLLSDPKMEAERLKRKREFRATWWDR